MSYTASEKVEIIRLVEGSESSVSFVLRELGIAKSTFYDWYARGTWSTGSKAWNASTRR